MTFTTTYVQKKLYHVSLEDELFARHRVTLTQTYIYSVLAFPEIVTG